MGECVLDLTAFVFDAEALLAFYLGEPGGKRVEGCLEEITRGESEGLMNVVNLSELHYILYRKSPELAAEKEHNLKGYGVEMVSLEAGDDLWKEAAEIKASYAPSLADAFAAATAKRKEATLVVGRDSEFTKITGIKMERIRWAL
jgi:predicted nucleic acid-binding protein